MFLIWLRRTSRVPRLEELGKAAVGELECEAGAWEARDGEEGGWLQKSSGSYW
jgi:hypothetical protein